MRRYNCLVKEAFCFMVSMMAVPSLFADGMVIDKVYHPYVDALESEIEFRLTDQDVPPGSNIATRSMRLSYGKSVSEKFFAEVYVAGQQGNGSSLDIDAIERATSSQLWSSIKGRTRRV